MEHGQVHVEWFHLYRSVVQRKRVWQANIFPVAVAELLGI